MQPPACKVCGSTTRRFGAVDFNRTCEDHKGPVFPPSGVAVTYYRCADCGLLFTPDFDAWSDAVFAERIYNDGYALADPEFAEFRPVSNARLVANELPERGVGVLDYGGGNGRFAAELRALGYRAETYDPFYSGRDRRPSGPIDLVTCFETFEHLPDPVEASMEIASLQPGLVFFSTLVQPPDVEAIGTRWGYIGPRNGHVTLYTREALSRLWDRAGMRFVSFTDNYHAAYVEPPAWAAPLLRKAAARA